MNDIANVFIRNVMGDGYVYISIAVYIIFVLFIASVGFNMVFKTLTTAYAACKWIWRFIQVYRKERSRQQYVKIEQVEEPQDPHYIRPARNVHRIVSNV